MPQIVKTQITQSRRSKGAGVDFLSALPAMNREKVKACRVVRA